VSTSQSATTFSAPLLKALLISDHPLPPAPMAAIFNLSLGAIKPFPSTCLGTIKKLPAARAPVFRKSLRRSRRSFFVHNRVIGLNKLNTIYSIILRIEYEMNNFLIDFDLSKITSY
jgi:hypothetical protein